MYRAREDRAASKFYAKKANDKAERLANVLEQGRQKVARMLDQANAVCLRCIPVVFLQSDVAAPRLLCFSWASFNSDFCKDDCGG